jgi:hypothetical protein
MLNKLAMKKDNNKYPIYNDNVFNIYYIEKRRLKDSLSLKNKRNILLRKINIREPLNRDMSVLA